MYVDSAGKVSERSLNGALAAGVPGSVAGLVEAHRKYGTRPWAELLQPAIDLAEGGFAVDTAFFEDSEDATKRLARDSASAALSRDEIHRGGRDLARAGAGRGAPPHRRQGPRRLLHRGDGGADRHSDAEERRIITLEDLAGYTPVWRTPVEFDYRGHHVVSMPPASSGGLTVALILGIIEGRDVASLGWRTPAAIHLLAEAERRAFARRNSLLGDPDFGPVPTAAFLSKDTAAALRAQITDRSSGSSGGGAAAGAAPHHPFFHRGCQGKCGGAHHHEQQLRGGVHGTGRPVPAQQRDG